MASQNAVLRSRLKPRCSSPRKPWYSLYSMPDGVEQAVYSIFHARRCVRSVALPRRASAGLRQQLCCQGGEYRIPRASNHRNHRSAGSRPHPLVRACHFDDERIAFAVGFAAAFTCQYEPIASRCQKRAVRVYVDETIELFDIVSLSAGVAWLADPDRASGLLARLERDDCGSEPAQESVVKRPSSPRRYPERSRVSDGAKDLAPGTA